MHIPAQMRKKRVASCDDPIESALETPSAALELKGGV